MKEIKTVETFEEIINNGETNIVKFFTTWCPDCTRMDMFIGEIMEANNDKTWYSLNKDELPEIAEKYDVMGIPSLLIFKDGKKTGHLHSANAKTPEQVEEFLTAQK
ncbi:thioredoxin family protein [Niallia sp. Sow4_A1]|jgi:thiol-disulfide isomerase/thioredoxin|uniref:Thioredoxin family protein n=1 Tax=Niallia hominis TaxID=3133173 RepID=A0ABV1F3D8_9BACI|nr:MULTISPECIES: thioredoxin family protein [Bacillaceae]MCF2649605.1 thioredoxin family protein [Niallia circulans]MCM3362130.1 thioredoxin family protein [Niallia sp. MER TA 168]CAI9386770.1 Thioredoxin-like protein YdbP [Bacillus sp. T2.9-1]